MVIFEIVAARVGTGCVRKKSNFLFVHVLFLMAIRVRMPRMTTNALASRIQKARIKAGYATPEAAAIVLAMHPEVYRAHEQGRHRVKPDELRRYAEAFRVATGWLSSGIGLGPAG